VRAPDIDESSAWIELRVPEHLELQQPERFLEDLQAGLDSANLALRVSTESASRPSSLPLASEPKPQPTPPQAVVIVAAPHSGTLQIRVEARRRSSALERTVHLDELPNAGRELALAILIEELIRAALAPEPEPALSAPETRGEPPSPFPLSNEPPQRFSSSVELGLHAVLWGTAPPALGGAMRVLWGTKQLQLGFEGTYARFLDRAADSGVAHGEIWRVGMRGFLNLLHTQRLRLGPIATMNAGEATFWAESHPGYEPGRLSGLVIDLGVGARAVAELGHFLLSLELGAAMPLAGVVATVDGVPLLDTTTMFGFSSFNLGATF